MDSAGEDGIRRWLLPTFTTVEIALASLIDRMALEVEDVVPMLLILFIMITIVEMPELLPPMASLQEARLLLQIEPMQPLNVRLPR